MSSVGCLRQVQLKGFRGSDNTCLGKYKLPLPSSKLVDCFFFFLPADLEVLDEFGMTLRIVREEFLAFFSLVIFGQSEYSTN